MSTTIGGMVLTEDAIAEQDVPEAGDVIDYNGHDHAVLGVRGNYDIERDEWGVIVKLGPLREPEIHGDDAPEWIREAVGR